jgi:peptide/nickel transport system substrate-binding protein
MNMVWPQVFIVNNKLVPVLNTQLMESATETSTSPQTIVYKLNPKAVWQDGTPITADDFIYNWQAQSGSTTYTDVGGKPYDTAATAGYNQIQSVVGSDPSGGAACDPGTAANRNVGMCPNGRTITVTFKPAFTDWRALFTNIVPAHISRTVGWNTGFTGAQQTISGSWFEIQSYNENQSLVLVRNPKYWGTPAKLDKLVFQFFGDATQLVPALQNKEVNIINPSTVSLSIVQTANQVSGVKTTTLPGLEFEHLDFNQADPYLAKTQVRLALAHGVNRSTIIARTVGEISKAVKPLGSRVLMPTQPGFKGTNFAYDPSMSNNLFKELGFKKGSDGYWQPNYGPQKGKDLTFTIQSTSGNPVRAQTEELFQSQMKAIGVKINIQNYDANTLFGTNLPGGQFQIADFAWIITPFVSANQSIYCSYTKPTTCGQNYNHASNSHLDTLLKNGTSAPSQSAENNQFNEADAILWHDMVTLPLYQKPQFWAYSGNLKGVLPNTSSVGVTWNANNWSISG